MAELHRVEGVHPSHRHLASRAVQTGRLAAAAAESLDRVRVVVECPVDELGAEVLEGAGDESAVAQPTDQARVVLERLVEAHAEVERSESHRRVAVAAQHVALEPSEDGYGREGAGGAGEAEGNLGSLHRSRLHRSRPRHLR